MSTSIPTMPNFGMPSAPSAPVAAPETFNIPPVQAAPVEVIETTEIPFNPNTVNMTPMAQTVNPVHIEPVGAPAMTNMTQTVNPVHVGPAPVAAPVSAPQMAPQVNPTVAPVSAPVSAPQMAPQVNPTVAPEVQATQLMNVMENEIKQQQVVGQSFDLPIDMNRTIDMSLDDEVNNTLAELGNESPETRLNNIKFEGMVELSSFKSAFYGGFRTILEFLSQGAKSEDFLNVKRGVIQLEKFGGFIYCDLNKLFGENDFCIINPAKTSKLMKLIKGGDYVKIFEDEIEKKYLISKIVADRADTKLKIDRADENDIPLDKRGIDIYPNFHEKIFETEIELEKVSNVVEAVNTTMVNMIFKINKTTNELISVEAQDVYEIILGEETTDDNIIKLSCRNPFPISRANHIILRIYRNKNENGSDLEYQYYVETANDLTITTLLFVESLNEIKDLSAAIQNKISIF